MNFPDSVEILRAYGSDEYGNPGSSWAAPSSEPSIAFVISDEQALMPADADVQDDDRLRFRDRLFTVKVSTARSPSRDVLKVLTLERIPEA